MMYPIAVKGHMPFSPTYDQRVREALSKQRTEDIRAKVKRTSRTLGVDNSFKIDTCSCPAIQLERIDTPRQRSKSATFLDAQLILSGTSACNGQGGDSNSNSSGNVIRTKLRKWFRPKSSKTKLITSVGTTSSNGANSSTSSVINGDASLSDHSKVSLDGNGNAPAVDEVTGDSTVLGEGTSDGDPSTSGSLLHRSYSLSTPHHIPKLDAIIEEDEAAAIARCNRALAIKNSAGIKRTRPQSANFDLRNRPQQQTPQFQQMFHWSDSESSCESLKDASRS